MSLRLGEFARPILFGRRRFLFRKATVHAPLLLRFIGRVASRHLVWHLLVPLVVGALVESAIAAILARLHGTPFGTAEFRSYFFSLERLGLLVGIFATFSWVLYWHMQKEAEVTRLTLSVQPAGPLGSRARRTYRLGAVALTAHRPVERARQLVR